MYGRAFIGLQNRPSRDERLRAAPNIRCVEQHGCEVSNEGQKQQVSRRGATFARGLATPTATCTVLSDIAAAAQTLPAYPVAWMVQFVHMRAMRAKRTALPTYLLVGHLHVHKQHEQDQGINATRPRTAQGLLQTPAYLILGMQVVVNDRESEDSALKRFRNLTKVSKVVYEVRSACTIRRRSRAGSVVSALQKQPVHAHAQSCTPSW